MEDTTDQEMDLVKRKRKRSPSFFACKKKAKRRWKKLQKVPEQDVQEITNYTNLPNIL